MKKIFLPVCTLALLLLFGFAQKAHAQEDKSVPQKQRIAVVKFAPLVLVEPEGGFQVGAEMPVLPNFSAQFDFAYLPFYYGNEGGGFFKTLKGFDATAYKLEFRYYITDRNFRTACNDAFEGKDLQGFYLAGQGQLKNTNKVDSALVFDNSGNSVILTPFDVKSTIYKANLKIGYQVITDNGFTVDLYTGAGFRHKTVRTSPVDFKETLSDDYNLLPINFALGIKLGMAF